MEKLVVLLLTIIAIQFIIILSLWKSNNRLSEMNKTIGRLWHDMMFYETVLSKEKHKESLNSKE